MQYVATGPWNDREMLNALTSPDIAKNLWRTSGATADRVRREFGGSESCFLSYVQALVERAPGCRDAQLAWKAYNPSDEK